MSFFSRSLAVTLRPATCSRRRSLRAMRRAHSPLEALSLTLKRRGRALLGLPISITVEVAYAEPRSLHGRRAQVPGHLARRAAPKP